MPAFSYRHATASEIQNNFRLFLPDRPLYEPSLWTKLPGLFCELLEARRVRVAAVHDSEGRVRMLGGCSFVDPRLFRDALHARESTVLNAIFAMAADGRMPFLSRKQVAQANAEGTLISLNFGGMPEVSLCSGPKTTEEILLFTATTHSYRFFHDGYQIQETWQEWALPLAKSFLLGTGFREVRERPCHNGVPSWLFRFTAEEARANPGLGIQICVLAQTPTLGLTQAEQELLEYSLLGHSDADIAELLDLTDDGLKKRWRAIYRSVQQSEPSLCADGAAPHLKRKILLDALRFRLEEIRPHSVRRAKPTPSG